MARNQRMGRACCAALVLAFSAMSSAMAGEWTGILRTHWLGREAAGILPVAQPSVAAAQMQWQGSAQWGGLQWHADVVAEAERPEGGPGRTRTSAMEAYVAGAVDSWQWSAGRKVVGWDVGYGFRPNDMVQQEARRSLVSLPLQGRPVLMAEHFSAESAWSLVAVNPSTGRDAVGAREPALAARWYQRYGEADAFAFARWGHRTHASVGAAFAWVASDALELHASLRHMARFDALANASPSVDALAQANPWRAMVGGAAQQLLLGGTWTSAQQMSVLLEAWHDGTAPSRGQWQRWGERNASLQHLGALGAPAAAVAANLAWQAQALNASTSLRRQNLYARLSWVNGAWEPAVDMLYHPEDGGRMLTAGLTWKGDRVRIESSLRVSGGPATALVRQIPVQRQAHVQAIWSF